MKSFLAGKKSLSVAALRPPIGAIASTGSTAGGLYAPGHVHAATGATVEVVKEGDKVVRLVVTCGCGERVDIECLYPAGG
jgi:hypothetical protein